MADALPAPVAALARELAALPGVVAVVLGGSRATGEAGARSDWDLGLYYRAREAAFAPEHVRALGLPGAVSGLGDWGPIMHGGAWLTADGLAVDVLFRELGTVERRLAEAREGRFEVLAQNGYVAGAPTYLPVGELAVCVPLAGELPRPAFPEALRRAAPPRWEGGARVALMFAEGHARIGDGVLCAGMLVHAVLCAAHARLAARGEWVLNEKRLVDRAGLRSARAPLADAARDLPAAVAAVSELLELEPLRAR